MHATLSGDDPADLLATFRAWQAELEDGEEQLLTGVFDPDLATRLRAILLEQWVQLRWREVMDFLVRP